MTQAASPTDPKAFRAALGQFATGVCIITARGPDGQPVGLTANSFNSVSLDPPLILWSLSLYSANLPAFQQATHYAVNILAADQVALSNQFASSREDKFDGVEFVPGLGGSLLLPGCCAQFECRNETRHAGGDHIIFIGLVERFARFEGRAPLVYQGGGYRGIAPLD